MCLEESSTSKSNAMGVLNFNIDPNVISQFNEFKVDGSINWIELKLENECLVLLSSKNVSTDSISSNINNDEASFVFFKIKNSVDEWQSFFIFSCPENVQIRTKMTMSSRYYYIISSLFKILYF